MCWTLNKVDKLNFMQQMGMWFVHDKCPGKEMKDILSPDAKDGLIGECCAKEALTKCAFSDNSVGFCPFELRKFMQEKTYFIYIPIRSRTGWA